MITTILYDCDMYGEMEVEVEWDFKREETLSPGHIYIEECHPDCVRRLLGDGVLAFKVIEAIEEHNKEVKLEKQIETEND